MLLNRPSAISGAAGARVHEAPVLGAPSSALTQTRAFTSSRASKAARVCLPSRHVNSLKLRAQYTEGRTQDVKQAAQALNIAFVSAEVAPWSKTGGLGDVVGGLPIELSRRGHKVVSIAPRYDQHWDAWDTSVTVNIDGEEVRYFHTVKDGVDRVWVDHPWFLAKVWGKTGGKLYGAKSGADYADNQKRFLLFNKAALRALEVLPFLNGFDRAVVVANDWHTSILPVLVKEVYQRNGKYTGLRTALCIHNIAFQGRFWDKDFDVLSLPGRVKSLFQFEDGYPRVFSEGEPDEKSQPQFTAGKKFEKINWLKAGILTADKLLTVSPNYAQEIAEDDEKGVELSDVIRAVGGLEGIVNGCDVGEWSPFLDKYLDVKYDAATMAEGKAVAKETLQAELGLAVDPNIPVFGFIGRLEEQKGVDILIDALPKVASAGGIQVVILGTGKKAMEAQVLKLDKTYPDAVKGVVKFDVPLAHLIIAGADFMLVPSRFEPCGLIQLHAMNYGTVPVVSSTGGLVDTVKDGVTGFHAGRFNPDKLDPADSAALAGTISRAKGAFHSPAFRTMQERCIVQELSWEKPAKKWEAVLEELAASPVKPTTQPPSTAARDSSFARAGSFQTPVQQVNREGDAVPQGAVQRKAAETPSVIAQNKPGPRPPAGAGAPPSRPNSFKPQEPKTSSNGAPRPANGAAAAVNGTSRAGLNGSASSNGNGQSKAAPKIPASAGAGRKNSQ